MGVLHAVGWSCAHCSTPCCLASRMALNIYSCAGPGHAAGELGPEPRLAEAARRAGCRAGAAHTGAAGHHKCRPACSHHQSGAGRTCAAPSPDAGARSCIYELEEQLTRNRDASTPPCCSYTLGSLAAHSAAACPAVWRCCLAMTIRCSLRTGGMLKGHYKVTGPVTRCGLDDIYVCVGGQ